MDLLMVFNRSNFAEYISKKHHYSDIISLLYTCKWITKIRGFRINERLRFSRVVGTYLYMSNVELHLDIDIFMPQTIRYNVYKIRFSHYSRLTTKYLDNFVPRTVKKIFLSETSDSIEISNRVTSLSMSYLYYEKYRIPKHATDIKFRGACGSQSIVIPDSLRKISLDYEFDGQISGSFNNLTHLTIGDSMDHFSKFIIPRSVTHLSLLFDFNQPIIDRIPKSVTHLTLGASFNQPIIGGLHEGLKYLVFGRDFNKPVINGIPKTVTTLKFGHNFNQSITGAIPNSVITLIFGYQFNQDITNAIPSSVVTLIFDTGFKKSISGNIPSSVVRLCTGSSRNLDNMPNSIAHLRLGDFFDAYIDNIIPKSVTRLIFGQCYDTPIDDALHDNITEIIFGSYFNQPIYGCIPRYTRYLEFGREFDQPIDGAIPYGVNYLIFGEKFNQPVAGNIPNSVTYLIFGDEFDHPIEGAIPPSIVQLVLGTGFDQNLIDAIPDTLSTLWINNEVMYKYTNLPPRILNIIKPYEFVTDIPCADCLDMIES